MCLDARKRAWLVLITLACAQLRPPLTAAQASRPRVVWAVPSAALTTAARKAFEPTQIVSITDAETLHAALDPRRLAREHGARAVVWVTTVTGSMHLYVYDAQIDGIVGTRPLPEPPLEAATAAAVVLSVKTYLGHGATQPGARQATDLSARAAALRTHEPEAQRAAGASPHTVGVSANEAHAPPAAYASARAAAETPGDNLVRAVEGASSGSARPGSLESSADRVAVAYSSRQNERTRLHLDLAANGGVRVAMHKLGPELRYGLSAQLHETDAAWGVMLDVSAGTGFRTQRAHLHEPAAALLGVWNPLAASGWRLAFVAGPALHWLLVDIESAGSAQRLRPHIYAGMRMSWHAPADWFIAVAVNADVPLISQRYWVDRQLALEARALGVCALVSAGSPLTF